MNPGTILANSMICWMTDVNFCAHSNHSSSWAWNVDAYDYSLIRKRVPIELLSTVRSQTKSISTRKVISLKLTSFVAQSRNDEPRYCARFIFLFSYREGENFPKIPRKINRTYSTFRHDVFRIIRERILGGRRTFGNPTNHDINRRSYHRLVEVQFVGRRLVGRSHCRRPIHAVVYLVERVETRAGVGVRDGLAQQFADLNGVRY